MNLVWDILLIVAITLVASVFVAAEIALVSLRESQVQALAERGKRGRRLADLVRDPNRFLAAVQVGVTVLGFLSAAIGAERLGVYLEPVLIRWGMSDGAAAALSLVLVTLAVAYVSLVLGELVPKRLGIQRAEGVSLAVAPAVDRIARFLRPVIWLLSRSTDLVVRLLGGDPNAGKEEITGEELRGLVANNESLTRYERSLIGEVLDAGARPIREVMVPRTDVHFLDASLTVSKAVRAAREEPHSRYPVVHRHSDDVVGFVHIRDLLLPERDSRSLTVGDLTREVARLPGSKKVLAALSEMRRSGDHLAIVVDEYGGTDGIVSLEDLIEEIVGDIRDEYDEVEPEHPTVVGVGEYEVDARVNLDEFRELTRVTLPDGPYETAAGFVMAQLGRLPVVGDEVHLRTDLHGSARPGADDDPADGDSDVTVVVTEVDGRRLSRLRVTRTTVLPDAPATVNTVPNTVQNTVQNTVPTSGLEPAVDRHAVAASAAGTPLGVPSGPSGQSDPRPAAAAADPGQVRSGTAAATTGETRR